MMDKVCCMLIAGVMALTLALGAPLRARAEDPADQAPPQLLNVTKEEGVRSSQLILDFSRLPESHVTTSGQRIDVVLDGVEPAPGLVLPAADETLVDVLLTSRPHQRVLSILLRRVPVTVKAQEQNSPARLVIQLHWTASHNRPAIARSLAGSRRVSADGVTLRREVGSKYRGHWIDFFRDYRAPFVIHPPLRFTLPDLGWPAGAKQLSGSGQLQVALTVGNWNLLHDALEKFAPADAEQARLGKLLLAEAKLRLGRFEEALPLLLPLAKDADDPRVDYLTVMAQAATGDRYGALVRLEQWRARQPLRGVWQLRAALLEAEIDLANGSAWRALSILEDPQLPWVGGGLEAEHELRLLDARALKAGLDGAAEVYRPWLERGLFNRHPVSMANAAVGLLRAGDMVNAQALLNRLLHLNLTPEAEALTRYAEILTEAALKPAAPLTAQLETLRRDLPQTEGGYRAWLLLLDRSVLRGDGRDSLSLLQDYAAIAAKSLQRSVREEAAFKRALLLLLNRRLPEAIEALDGFCRGFFDSHLAGEAEAALGEAVKPQILALIRQGDDLGALVLVERFRRQLLQQQDLDADFLRKLAASMGRLGLWSRAVRVYQYLLDGADEQPEVAARLYLPLVTFLYRDARFGEAERYAAEYGKRFPRGEDRCRLFELRLRSLMAQSRLDRVKQLLDPPDRPSDAKLEALACEVYWELNEPEQVLRRAMLADVADLPPESRHRTRFLQAESLYRLGLYRQALPLYQQLAKQKDYRDPALFRAARIQLSWGHKAEGTALLDQLLQQGSSSQWQALARDLLLEPNVNVN